MADANDSFVVELKEAHLNWGQYRNTDSREFIEGEAYIPIPKTYALQYSIFNSNHNQSGLGYNLFRASSEDGYLQNVMLLAQGSSSAGEEYAKQFSVQGNLQRIGDWYRNQNARPGDFVRVVWRNPEEVLLTIIHSD